MRLPWIALALLLAAGVVAWQAETRAELQQRLLLRALVAQAAPHGELSYGHTVARFWGAGRVESIRFLPAPELAAHWGWPRGAAMELPTLHYREWQQGAAWPAAIQLQFDTLRAPLAKPWPAVASGTLQWRYREDSGALQLAATLKAPEAAALEGTLALQLARPQQLSGAVLLGAMLDYRDAGLAQGARAALGLRRGADPAHAGTAFADALLQWLTQRGVPLTATQQITLHAFAREPLRLSVQLDPPGALRPETLRQFAPADRSAALGLSLSVP